MNLFESYRVELEAYSGPLDLLLFLVKRHEIDLTDIPIAKLTEQYLRHLEVIKTLDMDNVGEFLVMAATLLEIKSQMLLPRPTDDPANATADPSQSASTSLDPRYELVQQLLAYKRYKDAAMALDQRRTEWDRRFSHMPARLGKHRHGFGDTTGYLFDVAPDAVVNPQQNPAMQDEEMLSPGDEPEDAQEIDLDIDDVSIMDLCDAFSRILATIGQAPATHNVVYDDTPLALHAEDIVDRLERDGKFLEAAQGKSGKRLLLSEIFVGRASRSEMVGLFLAVLELVRQRRVKAMQEGETFDLVLELRPKEDAKESQNLTNEEASQRWRNPQTGEIEYEWASEADRKRAERRAKLRANFAAKKAAGEAVSEEIEDIEEEESETQITEDGQQEQTPPEG